MGDTLSISQAPDATFVLRGELDLSSARELEEVLSPAVARGGDLVIDASELSFIDASGIEVLIRAQLALPSERVVVRGAGPSIVRVLQLVGADQVPGLSIEP